MSIDLIRIIMITIAASIFYTKAYSRQPVALINRNVWNEKIESEKDFNAISYVENIIFGAVFNDLIKKWDSGELNLGIKHPNQRSIEVWRKRTVSLIVKNIIQSTNESTNREANRIELTEMNFNDHIKSAFLKLKLKYPAWVAEDLQFYSIYAMEQFRLAALSPAPTSEIIPIADNEILGNELPDKTYIITFDDGPTEPGGETDRIANMLRQEQVSALFFVTYSSFLRRLAVSHSKNTTSIYSSMYVGSHGREHVPHPKLTTWKESIDITDGIIESVFPLEKGKIPFRPPYGQRDFAIDNYLKTRGNFVVLWNIDSQDWNTAVPASRVGDRVSTLMLLWRRGIILFHDVHPKARLAIPSIMNKFKKSKIKWGDFHTIETLVNENAIH